MSDSIAEIRVGDLPKRVRSKLGLKDRADTDVVKVTTVDEVAGGIREQVSELDAKTIAERRAAVARFAGKKPIDLPDDVDVEDLLDAGRRQRDSKFSDLNKP